jgi:Flp pilus assembly protein TadG
MASLVLPVLLWVATLVAIALIDVSAYLVAASRAQSLADAAALAAVSTDSSLPLSGSPWGRAVTVVAASDGELERCTCAVGTGRAEAVVSVAVPGLLLPRLGAGRVEATAAAVLAPPPPG